MRLNPVDNKNGKISRTSAAPDADSGERRRVAKIVRDDLGNAVVEWVGAPAGSERVSLSIADDDPVRKSSQGYNPYEGSSVMPGRFPGTRPPRPPVKRDLRKLSEWIKQMRELEERKRRGDDSDE